MNLINNEKETNQYTKITVANGDGIGPEIMDTTLKILKHAGAKIACDFVEVGEVLYKKGYSTGISDEGWDIIMKNKVFLKAPITTPQGSGYKSINVTLRNALNLYANIRPCKSYHPFVATKHPVLDVVIIRENQEDLYSGIEYRQSHNMFECLKFISIDGCRKIVRYAFEYAKNNGRKKVTCMTKDNIMKMTDGLFHKVFDEIAKEYPEIQNEHYIIDIGSARLATKPEIFDVVVTLNLYGDIVSDIVAEITGSVGLAGSSNIGTEYAMFEAIHGSAPTMIGQKRANPSALINASIMMMAHIGQGSIAKQIEDALLYTIESGYHTPDIYVDGSSKKKLNTFEFGDAIIENLGQKPQTLKSGDYKDFEFDAKFESKEDLIGHVMPRITNEEKVLSGIDIYIGGEHNAEVLGKKVSSIISNSFNDIFELKFVGIFGAKSYPHNDAKYKSADHFRCRFEFKVESSYQECMDLLSAIHKDGLEVIKTENLYYFGETRGYTLAQGQ